MKKSVKDIDIKGKKVIMRVDFNVPLDKETSSKITDTTRVDAAMPTIEYILSQGASLILMSHLGRPKGEANPKYSLKPVYDYLKTKLPNNKVIFANDCIGEEVKKLASELKAGDVLLLENLRYHAEEEKNDAAFSKQLADLADVYVNDAFGTAHRAHASTAGIVSAKAGMPAVAGFLMEKEIQYLGDAVANPARPFVAIIGGAKVSSKISVLKNLLNKVDTLIVVGGMAYTFFKTKGLEIGASLCEDDYISTAKEIMDKAKELNKTLYLPVDNVIADKFDNDAAIKVVDSTAIPAGWMGMDVGPKTLTEIEGILKNAKTVVWNGPLGVFEMANFAKGTFEVAKFIANSGAVSIIGGGDSVSAVNKSGVADKMTHVSTGGGASLEFLEGIELPGIAVLQDK